MSWFPILLVTHTAPFLELVDGKLLPGDPKQFLNAYAGNSLVGAAILVAPQRIELAACAELPGRRGRCIDIFLR